MAYIGWKSSMSFSCSLWEFLFLIFIHSVFYSHAAKILMFPGPYSHFMVMSSLAEHLHKHGHNITMVTPLGAPWNRNETFYNTINFEVPDKLAKPLSAYHKAFLNGTNLLEHVYMGPLQNRSAFICQALAGNDELRQNLTKENFQLIIMDYFDLCASIVTDKMKLPFIVLVCTLFDPLQHGRISGLPSPLSYVPVGNTDSCHSDTMNFFQRSHNLYTYIKLSIEMQLFSQRATNEAIRVYHPDAGLVTVNELFAKAELILVNDDFTFQYPRPLTPNVKMVGGLSNRPAKPLSGEWQDIIDEAGDAGIIVFCLGSMIHDMNATAMEMFAEVFRRLPQRVIWKLASPNLTDIPANVIFKDWIPLNDLLGHPSTRAFLAHGGLNSIFQAIYHAVPVVGIPLFGDQHDTICRLERKGMAVRLDINHLTSEMVYTSLHQVIHNSSYRESAQKVSRMYHDKPMTCHEKAVFWVEYVLQHGGRHLWPASTKLHFLQYFLIDVIDVFLMVALLVLGSVALTARLLWRMGKKMYYGREGWAKLSLKAVHSKRKMKYE